MTHRFKRLLQPSSILGFALCTAGVNLGIAYALSKFHSQLTREYNVPLEEWGRFSGNVWSLQWYITLTVLVFYAMSVIFAPDPLGSDRTTLRRIIKRKLSQPLLTQDELELWSKLAEEVRSDDQSR